LNNRPGIVVVIVLILLILSKIFCIPLTSPTDPGSVENEILKAFQGLPPLPKEDVASKVKLSQAPMNLGTLMTIVGITGESGGKATTVASELFAKV
jgi:hypothetical protein